MRSAPSLVYLTVAGTVFALALAGCGEDGPDDVVGPPGPTAAPQITSVTPSVGGAGVNTGLTIIGSGFQAGATLTIGGVAVPLTFQNAARASATAPPHAPGLVELVLTNPNGDRATMAGGFRYIDLPVRLEVSGTTALQSIGETSQLTAKAVFRDGSQLDVTAESRWTTEFPWIATIGTGTGVVLSRALGFSRIYVQYPTTNSSAYGLAQVTVTPAGTFTLGGRVRQPGSGSVAGARVVHVDSGQGVDANVSGYFAFGGLTGRPRLRVTGSGFEDSETEQMPNEYLDVAIQRIVHLGAGSNAYSSELAPNDVTHNVGGGTFCQPCRLIRVTSGTPGPGQVTLRWTGPATLQIWINGRAFQAADGGREITADVNLGGGDTMVFVGRRSDLTIEDYIPFSVAVRQ
jgi:hypothetical protein